MIRILKYVVQKRENKESVRRFLKSASYKKTIIRKVDDATYSESTDLVIQEC